MVPMTDELFDAVSDGASERPLGFWKLPGGFDRVLADWSTAGPIGYIEADYFAGDGSNGPRSGPTWMRQDLVVVIKLP